MEQSLSEDTFLIDQYKDVDLYVLPSNKKRDFDLLYTRGLQKYTMNVPDDIEVANTCELYFCLPSYWKWDQEHMENKNFNFPLHWIKRIMDVPIERDTFIAAGHTFPAGSPPQNLCELTKQQAFVLGDPKKAKKVLEAIDSEVNYLAIIPLYKQELDYKQLNGSKKFYERFNKLGYDEEVNLARSPFKLKRFLFF